MGQGDVKMQTGFGAWVGALYGSHEGTVDDRLCAICAGYIVGGILGLMMMLLRGQLHRNLSNFKEIATDFRLLLTVGPKAAAQRAQRRRPTWHRLPYGIPLCIGFVGYLVYLHWFFRAGEQRRCESRVRLSDAASRKRLCISSPALRRYRAHPSSGIGRIAGKTLKTRPATPKTRARSRVRLMGRPGARETSGQILTIVRSVAARVRSVS